MPFIRAAVGLMNDSAWQTKAIPMRPELNRNNYHAREKLQALSTLSLSKRMAFIRGRWYFITGHWPVVKDWLIDQPKPMRICGGGPHR